MSDKVYQENIFDSFVRPPCAQQPQSSVQQYPSCTIPVMTSGGYNIQGHNVCEFMYGSQTMNRSQPAYTPTSFLNYPDQLEAANWVPDPRAVTDIERVLKFSDKMETIEITSKDLSPASCCSNLDMLIPDVYKTLSKDVNFYSKSAVSDSQWYYNINCGSQKYADYPSCSQVNSANNFMTVEEKTVKYYSTQKNTDFDTALVKTYNSNTTVTQCMQQYDKNVVDKTFVHSSQSETTLTDGSLYSHYENKVQESHLFSVPDLRHDQFYSQNTSLCNETLSFVDINNIDQPADGSNDESDIIVEESDDEVTDYSEDLERRYDYSTNCIICNIAYTPVGSQFYILNTETPLTMSSQRPVFSKLTEIVGTVVSKRNYVCCQCLSLINTIDHLQLKLETSKFELYSKYEKTCKENNLSVIAPSVCKTNANENKKIKVKNTKKFKHFCGVHSFKCKLCKKLFSFKKLYENHIMRHKLKNRFLCELCGQRFSKLSNFRSHRKSHSKVEFRNPRTLVAFTCTVCKKPFRTKTHLKEHENYCSGSLPYKCKHSSCNKKFATATKLKSHTKLKHDKKFVAICSICNIGFVKVSDYKSHKITHSTEKKFNCTKCEKSYKTISNLNYHMKSHNDKLPFICTVCNKGFMRKEYLESHVNNHNGIKNFACHFCSKKFVSQKNLDAHLKYHEGNIKTKICNICNKSVTTGFEEHLRTHSNLREFECEMCQMKFNTKGALAKHGKRKHSIKN